MLVNADGSISPKEETNLVMGQDATGKKVVWIDKITSNADHVFKF